MAWISVFHFFLNLTFWRLNCVYRIIGFCHHLRCCRDTVGSTMIHPKTMCQKKHVRASIISQLGFLIWLQTLDDMSVSPFRPSWETGIYHLCSAVLPGSPYNSGSVMEFASCTERAISGALLGTGMIQLELVPSNWVPRPPDPPRDLLRFPTYSVGDLPDLPQLLSTLPTSVGFSRQCLPLFLRAVRGAWHGARPVVSCSWTRKA
jgi:hypothetical protein